jgi:hypothetical protein
MGHGARAPGACALITREPRDQYYSRTTKVAF